MKHPLPPEISIANTTVIDNLNDNEELINSVIQNLSKIENIDSSLLSYIDIEDVYINGEVAEQYSEYFYSPTYQKILAFWKKDDSKLYVMFLNKHRVLCLTPEFWKISPDITYH